MLLRGIYYMHQVVGRLIIRSPSFCFAFDKIRFADCGRHELEGTEVKLQTSSKPPASERDPEINGWSPASAVASSCFNSSLLLFEWMDHRFVSGLLCFSCWRLQSISIVYGFLIRVVKIFVVLRDFCIIIIPSDRPHFSLFSRFARDSFIIAFISSLTSHRWDTPFSYDWLADARRTICTTPCYEVSPEFQVHRIQ